MITIAAMIAGAFYSAAYMAPKPWCYVFLVLSALLVAWMRASI